MKKISKLIFISLSIVLCFSFLNPERIGKKVFKILKTDKFEKIEKLYLEKEEFEAMIDKMDPKPPSEQIQKLLDTYESDRATFLNSFQNNLIEIDWEKAKIDSITYDYSIAKPGKDIKIDWPDSKNYKLQSSDMVKAKVLIYFHNLNKEHTIKFNMLNFKNKWKFSHLFKAPILSEK